jgi:hypothetical protein
MAERRAFGISFIGYFYIFGSLVLILILFLKTKQEISISSRFGVPNFPENIMRALVAVISLVLAYGYLKLKSWGYWLMMVYSIYFLITNLTLSEKYNNQIFYGNVIWSLMVIVYTLVKRKHFSNKGLI